MIFSNNILKYIFAYAVTAVAGWIAGRVPALGQVERGVCPGSRRQNEARLRLPPAVHPQHGEAIRPTRRVHEQVFHEAIRLLRPGLSGSTRRPSRLREPEIKLGFHT